METLRTLLKGLEENTLSHDVVIQELYNVAERYGLEEMMDDIITEESIDWFIHDRMEIGGWQMVACFLAKVDYLQDNYFLMDGYANLENITSNYLVCLIHDMSREVEKIED